MDLKKNPKANLSHKRGMFFFIALNAALLMTLTAFEWKTFNKKTIIDDSGFVCEFPEPPPLLQPPAPKSMQIIVLSTIYDQHEHKIDDEELFDYFDDDSQEISKGDLIDIIEEEIEEVESLEIEIPIDVIPTSYGGNSTICIFPEESPEYPGGDKAMYLYLAKNLKYPESAIENRMYGRVFIQFVISKDGTVTDVEVIKGIGLACDQAAKKVVMSMPKWRPGIQNGVLVNVRKVVPIQFKLK